MVKEPDSVFDLLRRISKIEGAALNTRGILFEMLVARLFNIQGFHIDIRKVVYTDSKEQVEIDVRAKGPNQIVCCECKGMSPGNLVGVREIEDWESRQLPRIKSWMKSAPEMPKNRRFIFWSSSGFSADAEKLIKELNQKHKKQPIEFLSGEDMKR